MTAKEADEAYRDFRAAVAPAMRRYQAKVDAAWAEYVKETEPLWQRARAVVLANSPELAAHVAEIESLREAAPYRGVSARDAR
jgi:hypothetical protein